MRSIRNLSIAAPLIAVTLAVVPNAAAQFLRQQKW